MERKLNFTAYNLMIMNILNSIIGLFGSTFLVAYFLQVSPDNIPNIALHYIITYAVMVVLFPLLINIVKRTKRVGVFRSGVFVKAGFILVICLLKEDITTWIIPISLLNGIAESLYWSSYNIMKNEILSSKIMMKFQEVNSLVSKIVNLVLPIVLGSAIEYSSFLSISFYILALAILQFVFSFFVKNPDAAIEKYRFRKFVQKTKNPELKPLKHCFYLNMVNGFKAILGTLTTIVIMMTFNSNMSLGFISSIFSVVSIIGTFVFFKIYKPEKSRIFYILCGFLPVAAVLGLLFSMSKTTFIIFNFVYTVCMVGPEFMVDVIKNRTIREVSMHRYISEHQAVCEIYTNSGRIFIYGALYLLSLLQNTVVFQIFLVICSLSLPLLTYIIHKMEIEMIEYHKKKKLEKEDRAIKEFIEKTPEEQEQIVAEAKAEIKKESIEENETIKENETDKENNTPLEKEAVEEKEDGKQKIADVSLNETGVQVIG